MRAMSFVLPRRWRTAETREDWLDRGGSSPSSAGGFQQRWCWDFQSDEKAKEVPRHLVRSCPVHHVTGIFDHVTLELAERGETFLFVRRMKATGTAGHEEHRAQDPLRELEKERRKERQKFVEPQKKKFSSLR